CPTLDLEDNHPIPIRATKLDLPSFEVTLQRREHEPVRLTPDDAHGPVPGRRHPDHELVADTHRSSLPSHLSEGRELGRGYPVRIRRDHLDQVLSRDAGILDPRPVEPVKERSDAVARVLDLVGAHARGNSR